MSRFDEKLGFADVLARSLGIDAVRGLFVGAKQVVRELGPCEGVVEHLGVVKASAELRHDGLLVAADVRVLQLDQGLGGLEHADVTDRDQARGLIENVAGHFGRLDVLVNSAATFAQAPFLDASDDEWERAWEVSLATNLVAPARLARLAAPHLAAAQGTIVNLIDINANLA